MRSSGQSVAESVVRGCGAQAQAVGVPSGGLVRRVCESVVVDVTLTQFRPRSDLLDRVS